MKRLLLFFLSFTCIVNAYATHNRAGEITFRQVGARTYEATITTYTKTDAPADRCNLTIQWGDGATDVLFRNNGPADRGCQYGGEPIYNNIKKNKYIGRHTYSTPGSYKVSMMDYNRNEGVKNIAGSVTVPFYIESYIYVPADASLVNNSPLLLNPPTDFGCIYTPFIHNVGAYDTNGDSLAYHLVSCRGLNGVELDDIYSPKYNLDDSHISIDHFGTITWDSPNTIGEFNIAVEIIEYRKNSSGEYYPIGKILRDMQIDITDCKNDPPIITSDDVFCTTAGKSITFDISASDPNGDKLTLSVVGGPFLSANPAIFSVPQSSRKDITGIFLWTPQCDDVRKTPYYLTVKANDWPVDKNGNPLSGLSAQKVITLSVLLPPPTDLIVIPSAENDAINLSWTAPNCENVNFYRIYRKTGSSSSSAIIPCGSGVDKNSGYVEIGTSTQNSFSDTKDIPNSAAMTYCYVVTAVSNDVESTPCQPNCTTLPLSRAVIREVSVKKTDFSQGNIFIKWVRAKDIDRIKYPPPYTYSLFYSKSTDFSSASLLASALKETDTTFTHSGVNTSDVFLHHYRTMLYSQGKEVGYSPTASQPYLHGKPSNRSAILSVEYAVPWSVDSVVYFQKKSETLEKISTVKSSYPYSFPVKDLVNGQEYTFLAYVYGHYDHQGIVRPVVSISNYQSVIPVDDVVECPPELSIEQDCDADVPFRLYWIDPTVVCGADAVDSFKVYHRKNQDSEWTLVYKGKEKTWEIPEDKRFGQYGVLATDKGGNVSDMSNVVSVILCHKVLLPNVFTPNGDGKNDVFTPLVPLDKGIFHIDIFSRWGKKVFSTDDPLILWDGCTQGGSKCSDGVYFYNYSFTPDDGEKMSKSGFVHIFR
ncbi:MAG: gliding motility-associated C-terminal domain-containing protein [Flavobacteriales bacterium]|nr:gliding motility-associated C-terminal domain-containing protein [Flavobacteriales bacterium]